MNNCVPGWNMENDPRYFHHLLPASNEKNYVGQDDSLIELLWKNGQVVLHNQTSCSSPATVAESKQLQRTELASRCRGSHGNSMNMIHVDEAASWYPNPFDEALENEFQEFFLGMRSPDSIVIDKENGEELCMNFCSAKDVNSCASQSSLLLHDSMMLPPKLQVYDSPSHSPGLEIGLYSNLTHQTKSVSEEMGLKIDSFGGVASGSGSVLRMDESSSMVTIESRICGSRQNQKDTNNGEIENSLLGSAAQNCQQEIAFDPLLSSSSGDSGSNFRREEQQVTPNHGHKRKARDAEESEHQIKNPEQASPEANKHAKKAAPLRRSRVSEIHNLSERRRRDRINEKMKALQDLIPHCNKPDKASMLDEAIEYLKSLQLQVQILWMGGGMAPMVFPGLCQYMQCANIGMNHPSLQPISNPVHLPGAALYNHFIPPISTQIHPPVCLSPGITPTLSFTNQMPNVGFPEPFLRYFSFPRAQMPPRVMQHNQTTAPVASNLMPSFGTSSQNIRSG